MLQSLPARRATPFLPLPALATVVVAAPRPAGADAPEPALDQAVFEQLKSRAGRWEGRVDDASAAPVALEMHGQP
jgi:hypothetical protein